MLGPDHHVWVYFVMMLMKRTVNDMYTFLKFSFFSYFCRRRLCLASLAVCGVSSWMAAGSPLPPTVLGSHPVMRAPLNQGHTSLRREDMCCWVTYNISLLLSQIHLIKCFSVEKEETVFPPWLTDPTGDVSMNLFTFMIYSSVTLTEQSFIISVNNLLIKKKVLSFY